jgi:hypothetical protein
MKRGASAKKRLHGSPPARLELSTSYNYLPVAALLLAAREAMA